MLAGLSVERVRKYSPGAPFDDTAIEAFLDHGSREVEAAMRARGVTMTPDNTADLLDAASAYTLHFALEDARGAADASGDAPVKRLEDAGTKIEFELPEVAENGSSRYSRAARRLLVRAGCLVFGRFPGAAR